ncbi:hypothetical protein SFRURICE_015268, partial [Spodoptera frugiperda]
MHKKFRKRLPPAVPKHKLNACACAPQVRVLGGGACGAFAFLIGILGNCVLKSYVITSYALDNTLHAICYHHVDNQRGSLVKQ